MTGILIRKRRGEFETQRGRPCEDGNRDWSHATTNQGLSRIAGNHQKLEEMQGTDSSSERPEGANPPNTLIPDF